MNGFLKIFFQAKLFTFNRWRGYVGLLSMAMLVICLIAFFTHNTSPYLVFPIVLVALILGSVAIIQGWNKANEKKSLKKK